MEKYTPEELAESFLFPVKLTAKQRRGADAQLKEARAKTQALELVSVVSKTALKG